jgi:hypothetical protein
VIVYSWCILKKELVDWPLLPHLRPLLLLCILALCLLFYIHDIMKVTMVLVEGKVNTSLKNHYLFPKSNALPPKCSGPCKFNTARAPQWVCDFKFCFSADVYCTKCTLNTGEMAPTLKSLIVKPEGVNTVMNINWGKLNFPILKLLFGIAHRSFFLKTSTIYCLPIGILQVHVLHFFALSKSL